MDGLVIQGSLVSDSEATAPQSRQAASTEQRTTGSPESKSKGRGVWLVVLFALFAASLEPVLAKVGYRSNLDPWQLIFIKNSVGAMAILPLVHAVRRWKGETSGPPLTLHQKSQVVVVALLLLVTGVCMLWAVKTLPAVTVITLVTTTPAFVALVNQRQGRDRLTSTFWAGFVVCFLGVMLSTGSFFKELSGDRVGLGLVAASIVSSTIYRTRLEVLTRSVSPLTVSQSIFLLHGLLSWTFMLPLVQRPDSRALAIGTWVGLAAALANVGFLYSIHLVGSTNMSIFNLLQRPLVVVVAALVLGESMSWLQWIGVVMVLVGVRYAQVQRQPEVVQPAQTAPTR